MLPFAVNMDFLHPCSDAPTNNTDFKEKDIACLREISKHYITTNGGIRLGSGNNATVYKLHSRRNYEDTVAVKIVPYEDIGNKEVGIACELNSMKDLTPCVIRTYGYLVCDRDGLHRVWLESVPAPFNMDKTYMLMFMEAPPYKWKYANEKDDPFPIQRREDAMALFFIMAHALYILRKKLGFVHGDLHNDNVLLSIQAQDRVRLFFNENDYSDVDLPYNMMPKFIDYGTAYTHRYAKTGPTRPFTDTQMLLNLFDATTRFGRADVNRLVDMRQLYQQHMSLKLQKIFETEETGDYAHKIIRIMLRQKGIFDNVSTIRHGTLEKPAKRAKRCIQCGIGDGTHMLEGKDGVLCGSFCDSMIGDMGLFLPKY